MSRSVRSLAAAVCLVALSAGTAASGALAACAPLEGCPMMELMASDHCGTGASLTANCCASMSGGAEPVQLPRATKVDSVPTVRSTGAEPLAPNVEPAVRLAPRGADPPPVPLYTLFGALLT